MVQERKTPTVCKECSRVNPKWATECIECGSAELEPFNLIPVQEIRDREDRDRNMWSNNGKE